MRVVLASLLLIACGHAPEETTLPTHTTRMPAADAPRAGLALGEVRWIDVGGPVRDVSASARRIAAVLDDGAIVTFDLESGARATARPADPSAPPTLPSLSPNGSLLAHCVATEVSVIDVEHGRYGVLAEGDACAAPALWSPDGARVYVRLQGNRIRGYEIATATSFGEADVLGGAAFVADDGSIVSVGDGHADVLDPTLAALGRYAMPMHEASGAAFLLATLDRTTFVVASGDDTYDVMRIHASEPPAPLWQSPQHERWQAVFPIANARALVLAERDEASFLRIVDTSTGASLGEIHDVTRPLAVAPDRSVAVATQTLRLAVIGLR